MSAFDAAEITFPSGNSYKLVEGLSADETFTPRWLFDGGGNAAALAGYVPGLGDEQNTEQAYVGTGSAIRQFTIGGEVKAEGMEAWGDAASDSDDVIQKLQAFGNERATSRIDSSNPCVLKWGEYHPDGRYGPIQVVPGEIQLPFNAAEKTSVSSVLITTNWLTSVDLQQVIHQADPTN